MTGLSQAVRETKMMIEALSVEQIERPVQSDRSRRLSRVERAVLSAVVRWP